MFNFLSAVEDIREYMDIYVLKSTYFYHLRKGRQKNWKLFLRKLKKKNLITTPLKVLAHQISEFSLQDDGPLAGFKGSLVEKNAKKTTFFHYVPWLYNQKISAKKKDFSMKFF